MEGTSRTKIYFLLFIAAVIWGFQPVCLKWLLPEWSPETITTVRLFLFGGILLAESYRREGIKILPDRQSFFMLFVMGSCYMMNNVFQFTGLRYTTVTNTTLIVATGPVLTALLAGIFMKERLSLISKLGVLISLAGTFVVISDGNPAMLYDIDFNIGDVLCFLAQLSWTGYSLFSIGLMKKLSVLTVTGWSALFSAMLTSVYGIMEKGISVTPLSPIALGAFCYLVFLGGIIATIAWNEGVKAAGASVTSMFLYIMPVVGMLSGWLILDEYIDGVKLCGAAAIFLGVFLTTHSH